jgi:hypothetical protein
MPQATARDWRASSFPIGIAHSIVGGAAWKPTPWRAVQRARRWRHARELAAEARGLR